MPTCWHFSRKVSKWPHKTNPAFTLMRRPGVPELGRSKGTNRKNYVIVGVTSPLRSLRGFERYRLITAVDYSG